MHEKKKEKKAPLFSQTFYAWKKSTPVFPNFNERGKQKHPSFPKLCMPGKKAPQFSQALRLYKLCWMNETHTKKTPTTSQVYLLCFHWKWTQLGSVQFCCCCRLCQTCIPLPAENFPITSVITFLHTNINLIYKEESECLSVYANAMTGLALDLLYLQRWNVMWRFFVTSGSYVRAEGYTSFAN